MEQLNVKLHGKYTRLKVQPPNPSTLPVALGLLFILFGSSFFRRRRFVARRSGGCSTMGRSGSESLTSRRCAKVKPSGFPPRFCGLDDAALKEMESELQNLRNENDRLRDKLIDNEQQLAEARARLVGSEQQLAESQTLAKELESENLSLQRLLAEKNDTDNFTAPMTPETIPEVVVWNQTTISAAKKTPDSNRVNKVQSSENANVHRSNLQDEARELDCCRRHMCISGNGADENSSACVYHMLAEALVGMKFSLKNEMEGFSLTVYHEASGYNFTLTWLEQPDGGEWAYKYSSLGTLERIAKEWMKQDVRFSMTMCPVFFQRLSCLISQG